MPDPNTDIRLGDVVRMRKPHPCGSYLWEVVRLGADIGIRCQGCQHRVLLPRSRFVRQMKLTVSRGEDVSATAAPAEADKPD